MKPGLPTPEPSPDFVVDLSFAMDADLAGESEAKVIGGNVRAGIRTTRRRFYDLSNVDLAIALLGPLPKQEETVHVVLGGNFHAWDLVPALQITLKAPVKLTLTTLGFSLATNGNLCDMLDSGKVASATLVVSDFFARGSAEIFTVGRDKLLARGQRILAARNHSKVLLLETVEPAPNRRHLVIEGSSNLRSCGGMEQISLADDLELFTFHAGWIEKLFAA